MPDSIDPHPMRYFSPDPAQRRIAAALYDQVATLPLICPHGHVDPRLFADPGYRFGSPVDLLIIPDHYIFRMLYSQGIALERLGIPRVDGGAVETDHRKIWALFARHFYLFRGTPTGLWLRDELRTVFAIHDPLNEDTADAIYDRIAERLAAPDFQPRKLYEQFRIEVLATTDAATDTLEHHQAIRELGWPGRIVPTFRPDAVINLDTEGWWSHIQKLSAVSGIEVHNYTTFVQALEGRRAYFKGLGATATDHGAISAYTEDLSDRDADIIFQRARGGSVSAEDATRFTGHMLMQMARMSIEDGLVMQLHVGSLRNHNPALFGRFGRDKGADIPVQTEFTRALHPLLGKFGTDPRLTLILFTLDETTYSRELAPLAGHYPALKLGPPWWFFDSLNGMQRYLDNVIETAGLYNTAGFNDDTRAFLSIPARHSLWRRVCADWLAKQVVMSVIDESDADAMIGEMAYGLAKRAYRFG